MPRVRRAFVATNGATAGSAIFTETIFVEAAATGSLACRRHEQDTRRNIIAPCDLCHLRTRLEALCQDPHLIVVRPAPPPLDTAQNFDPHQNRP